MIGEFIKVEPFSFKKVLAVNIDKGINSHGGGTVRGYIRETDEEQYASYPLGTTPVVIKAVGENGEEQVFFYGILADLNIERENSQLLMELKFTAYTKLMDLTPVNRAFQAETCTYADILTHLLAGYEGSAFIMQTGYSSVPIQELVVQYQETNWEFLRRLASHFYGVIIPDFLTPGVKFYFGLPSRQPKESINDSEYRLEKSLTAHQYKQQNGVTGTSEYDDMSVIWKSRELFEIGDRILFEDRPYVVCMSSSQMDGHQLQNTYVLSTENGLKIPKFYNDKVIGASIDGVVTGVKSTVVSVQMGIEDVQPSARWYPYATVFSSPDGSGWYCMPQVGDEIRLYFPTRSEKHAYAVSSVHKAVASKPRQSGEAKGKETSRSNPLSNELRSPDGKVVQLLSDRIVMSNGNGLSVAMVDNVGIQIVSSGNLDMSAGGNLYINGSDLNLTGTSQVSLMSGSSVVLLKDNDVSIKGSNVKVQ